MVFRGKSALVLVLVTAGVLVVALAAVNGWVTAQNADPLTPEDSTDSISEPAPALPGGEDGFADLGLVSGVHYPPDRLIIAYRNPIGPVAVVDEADTHQIDLRETLEASHPITVGVSESLDDAEIDYSGLVVTGGVAERGTYFVQLDGASDPLEVAFALMELEEVEYAHPDYHPENVENVADIGDADNTAAGPEDDYAPTDDPPWPVFTLGRPLPHDVGVPVHTAATGR